MQRVVFSIILFFCLSFVSFSTQAHSTVKQPLQRVKTSPFAQSSLHRSFLRTNQSMKRLLKQKRFMFSRFRSSKMRVCTHSHRSSSPSIRRTSPSRKEAKKLRIMPLGDSITEALRGHASYRYFLWKMLKAKGYSFTFVGSRRGVFRGKPKFAGFGQAHEGHWGWKVDQILRHIDEWMVQAKPDVVLCHLGTNDIFRRESLKSTMDELKLLVQKIRKHRPNVTILFAKLIPAKYQSSMIVRFNQKLEGFVRKLYQPNSRLLVIDQWTGFSVQRHTYDGVHPNQAGERMMASRWLKELQPFFKVVKKASLQAKKTTTQPASASKRASRYTHVRSLPKRSRQKKKKTRKAHRKKKIARRSARPEKAIAYTSFQGKRLKLTPWKGQFVAFLVPGRRWNRRTMKRLLDVFDRTYLFFKKMTGQTPKRMLHYQGRLSIAVVPETPGPGKGVSSGYLGHTGIEVQADVFRKMFKQVRTKNRFNQVLFYEFGRNFWFFNKQLKELASFPGSINAKFAMSTAYASFMRFLAMEAVGVRTTRYKKGVSWAKYRKELLGLVKIYEKDPKLDWKKTLREGKSPTNKLGLSSIDLLASILFSLRDEYGGNKFVARFWREVSLRPHASGSHQALHNFILAASLASRKNLGKRFTLRWRWPMAKTAEKRLALLLKRVLTFSSSSPEFMKKKKKHCRSIFGRFRTSKSGLSCLQATKRSVSTFAVFYAPKAGKYSLDIDLYVHGQHGACKVEMKKAWFNGFGRVDWKINRFSQGLSCCAWYLAGRRKIRQKTKLKARQTLYISAGLNGVTQGSNAKLGLYFRGEICWSR